jgi:hypothetical protein
MTLPRSPIRSAARTGATDGFSVAKPSAVENPMKSHAEIEEGPAAFERFRKAMKTIVGVRKSDVIDPPKPSRKKKPINRKG